MKKKSYLVRVTCRNSGRTVKQAVIEGRKLAEAAFPNYRSNRAFAVKVLPSSK